MFAAWVVGQFPLGTASHDLSGHGFNRALTLKLTHYRGASFPGCLPTPDPLPASNGIDLERWLLLHYYHVNGIMCTVRRGGQPFPSMGMQRKAGVPQAITHPVRMWGRGFHSKRKNENERVLA